MALKKRSYTALINRLNKSLNHNAKISTVGHIKYYNNKYPFKKIILGNQYSNRVLISAGIHGDEPAGIEAICTFLENKRYKDYLDKWEITILPCMNPYGFENNTRENHENKDLNRFFKYPNPPHEVQLAKSIFLPSYFDMTIELHEDCDSYGYYLFQKSNNYNGRKIGFKIIDSLKGIIQVNSDELIDDMPADNGVIHRLKDIRQMDWWPMAGYSFIMKTGHCFTFETPTKMAMSTRVEAHLVALEHALMGYQ
jgi:murein peptide amidase A